MSSITDDRIGGRHRAIAPWLLVSLWVFLCGTGCRRAAEATRLNPDEAPERYRVVCNASFQPCEAEARRTCEDGYVELSRESNRDELPSVEGAIASSTGPSHGIPDFRGELVIQCGNVQKPLRLVRTPPAATTPGPERAPSTASAARPDAVEPPGRVCVPGVTQACLGPGACSGAQACLDSGTGFGPCDCGLLTSPAPTTTTAAAAVPTPPVDDPADGGG